MAMMKCEIALFRFLVAPVSLSLRFAVQTRFPRFLTRQISFHRCTTLANIKFASSKIICLERGPRVSIENLVISAKGGGFEASKQASKHYLDSRYRARKSGNHGSIPI